MQSAERRNTARHRAGRRNFATIDTEIAKIYTHIIQQPDRTSEGILKKIVTATIDETLQLGVTIGRSAPARNVIALRGGLGAGKTTLCKGIGAGLGIAEEITSPTYQIIAEYRGRLTFYHIDAYRLSGFSDFAEIGGLDLLGAPESLCVIEWSERLPEIEEDCTAFITIGVLQDSSREFLIEGRWLEDLLQ